MKTVDLGQRIENNLNDLLLHSASLERDVADLKRVIRIMANAKALDTDGNVVEQYTQEEADFIKRIVERVNVFRTIPSVMEEADE